ncbi:MAG: squalene synthase HpnC [Ignavibacteriae bacterium]|nr:squalene synthase HpnC [Ignavibacteriota bacterium]
MARKHYENFPVASFFLPARLRPYVAAIYAYARTADDFADEGRRTQSERLAALDDWHKQLIACNEGEAKNPIFVALAEVIRRKKIPVQLLSDLLSAFKMDVTNTRFATYQDALHYCKHSANPIGRLMLYLFDDVNEGKFELSDNICTALQLANFWQDVAVDTRKGRIYIPLEDMSRFAYTEHELEAGRFDKRFESLMRFETGRTRELFISGKPLLSSAAPELRFELRLTWNGGMRILKEVESNPNVFRRRPTLGVLDKFSLIVASLIHRTS